MRTLEARIGTLQTLICSTKKLLWKQSMLKLFIRFTISLFALAAHISFSSELGDCEKVFSVSASAFSNKEKGMDREVLIHSLPKPSEAVEVEPLRSMREIIEDVYSYKITDQFVYSVYKTEFCLRRNQGKVVPVSFANAYPLLEKCSKESRENKASCAMIVAGSKPE
ncbi:hypothetical protein [Sapientia aquatica]|uniref:Uncharacterized protein n=1 Tax=Sapientia aquatica TaxID=1549640 RepID=A0A4R5W249_9BURK|nr:hypothetical protein [Sapientia aquatica]TDK66402.1 hypothetical protein E2I14_07970 [Sapientia aquatica]